MRRKLPDCTVIGFNQGIKLALKGFQFLTVQSPAAFHTATDIRPKDLTVIGTVHDQLSAYNLIQRNPPRLFTVPVIQQQLQALRDRATGTLKRRNDPCFEFLDTIFQKCDQVTWKDLKRRNCTYVEGARVPNVIHILRNALCCPSWVESPKVTADAVLKCECTCSGEFTDVALVNNEFIVFEGCHCFSPPIVQQLQQLKPAPTWQLAYSAPISRRRRT